jgi:predicted O-linked N-acetylglucosamine transferase (SPINDLY family)
VNRKTGRNDPCPCGSGRKYKNCCQRRSETRVERRTDASLQDALEHHRAGRLSEAESLVQQVLRAEPRDPVALHFSGILAHQRGNHALAVDLIGRSLAIRPDDAEAHFNLGTILQQQGELRAAARCYRNALRIAPGAAEAHINLGNTLKDLGEADEALACYRKAVSIRPDDSTAHFNFGNLCRDQGNPGEAAAHYRSAIRIRPAFAEAHNNLGNALKDLGDIGEALACYREALTIRPDYAEAHFNLGNVLRDQGAVGEALARYRTALSIRPDYADAYTNMLFLHAYHGSLDPQDYLALARGWEQACVPERERQAARERMFQPTPLTGRRLRLGYVSGDFRTHAVSYFVEQLFAHHDRTRIELFAYSTCAGGDAVTARLQALVEHWVPSAGGPDAALRDRIEADGIDVLIDLSGHTGHNRLGVFARRAAPVQAHYLGYMASTGLSEMDYWIGDETLTPPATDAYYSETIWRLPRVWVAYEGKADAPAPARRAPADEAIWVGGFNHLAKLTPATLALWARVLGALPQARLLLKTKALAEAENRRRILDAMAGHGISPERIELRDIRLTPDWSSHMACYDSLDIALDPVGAIAGGTTSCDALWMGVPVVTLMGDRMASRMTASMLRALGHEEWIARSERDYIQKVVDLARDAQRRSALRFELRGQMAQSPLCDARGLARSLEAAYFEMVERWLRRRTH